MYENKTKQGAVLSALEEQYLPPNKIRLFVSECMGRIRIRGLLQFAHLHLIMHIPYLRQSGPSDETVRALVSASFLASLDEEGHASRLLLRP